jgi:hypothetical protein
MTTTSIPPVAPCFLRPASSSPRPRAQDACAGAVAASKPGRPRRKDAVELCGLIRPRIAIPLHYEGWKHFKEGRDEIEREFARAPEDIRRRIRWLPIGTAVELTTSSA